MTLAELSIKRPTFITCIVLLMLAIGLFAMSRLGVDLFPDVSFPVVVVNTAYPGAGPAEIETLVSKPLEDELGTLSGLKRLSSTAREGLSTVVAEFRLGVDVKIAEQQVRDRVGAAKRNLPNDADESVIRRIDPSDQPVLTLALEGNLPEQKLYDVADELIRPRLEQVSQVGFVYILGGRKREIHVELDRAKLKAREISATQVVQRLAAAGENIPVGKVDLGAKELVFRSLGQFSELKDIGRTIISFFGNDVPTRLSEVATIQDRLQDETSRAFVNGKRSLFLNVIRQSGSNTIQVVDSLKAQIVKINADLKALPGSPAIHSVRDGSLWIHANVEDVRESILIGVLLSVLVVYLFLASGRSTIITGLALPNSLIGAFILMWVAGFTINIMTLLALSLSVGLLVDDAIVVRENIFRHIELGKKPREAALFGTREVQLAVIATTLTVIAVFGPVAFLQGVVGQFFKAFGLTVCFAMAISLFDALTIAPMLSAYFAGTAHGMDGKGFFGKITSPILRWFDRFQTSLEVRYEGFLRYALERPKRVLFICTLIAIACFSSIRFIPKTFLPPQDAGEFAVSIDLPSGTSLEETTRVAREIDEKIRANPEVEVSALTAGNQERETNVADFYVKLVPAKKRALNTIQLKEKLRGQLTAFAYANPKVKDYDAIGGGWRPFNVNILGSDTKQLEEIGQRVFEKLRKHPGLKDPEISFKPGKPEFQIQLEPNRAQTLGVSTAGVGMELRTLVEGAKAAKFREEGREYDIRVRLKPDQRNLQESFSQTWVPNINFDLVRLGDIAKPIETTGPSKITRQDRARYVQIGADITPGAGMGDVMQDIDRMFAGEDKLPSGMSYRFVGQAEDFVELGKGMMMAMGFGTLFIFLVLASLYESFITPFSIALALPLAMCGSFVALAITGQSLNIFSMIGVVMLLGVAAKNSILLVDYAKQLMDQGKDMKEAMILSGRTRLRPILMTTMTLIAGSIPIAVGLNEASRQRTSMGIAIVGGLISSTLLTLLVVPTAFGYIERFRIWSLRFMKRTFTAPGSEEDLGTH